MKRKGANLVRAMEEIDSIVESARPVPPAVSPCSYINNSVPTSGNKNVALTGNMATAMILGAIVVIATVGVRSGRLVTLAVPFSFFSLLS